jgi:hypothetical protein
MTIRIYDNRIEFDNYTLSITAKGLDVLRKNTSTYATLTSGSYSYLNPYLGENTGYVTGGWINPGTVTTIDRMPLRDYNMSFAVGNLSQTRYLMAGHSSSLSGYVSGGLDTPGITFQTIDKFPFFGITTPATSVGNLGVNRFGGMGQSSNTAGYKSGGFAPGAYSPSGRTDQIRKFPFAVDSDAVAIPGVLTQSRYYGHGHQSLTHGYSSGGYTTLSINTIDKFPFAADSISTSVGSLSRSIALATGVSSIAYGYVAGGGWPGGGSPSGTLVERFSFITNQNSVGIGNLNTSRFGAAGYSSVTSGYIAGGFNPTGNQTIVERFPFASGPNAILCFNITSLTQARGYNTGHQN